MSDNLQKFTRAVSILRNAAVRVPDDAWDNRSCCSEWSARELAGHATGVLSMVTAMATGDAPENPASLAEAAGPDPSLTIATAVDGCLASLDRDGVLHTVAATPFGEMPVDNFLGVILLDSLLHAWDIADAAGIDPGIDDLTAVDAQGRLEPMSEGLQASGFFGAPVEPASDRPVDRLVALAGRRSVQS